MTFPGSGAPPLEPESASLRPNGTRTATGRLNRMEFKMSIKSRIAVLALAALAVTGSMASTTQAQARPLGWGWGVGAGLVGAAIVGSAVAASDPYYYRYHRCGWVSRYDAFGHYIGSARACY